MLAPASDSDVGNLRETVVLIVCQSLLRSRELKMFDFARSLAIGASTHSALVSISKSRLMAAARQNLWSFAFVWLITAAANHWNAIIKAQGSIFSVLVLRPYL